MNSPPQSLVPAFNSTLYNIYIWICMYIGTNKCFWRSLKTLKWIKNSNQTEVMEYRCRALDSGNPRFFLIRKKNSFHLYLFFATALGTVWAITAVPTSTRQSFHVCTSAPNGCTKSILLYLSEWWSSSFSASSGVKKFLLSLKSLYHVNSVMWWLQ